MGDLIKMKKGEIFLRPSSLNYLITSFYNLKATPAFNVETP